MLRVRTTIAPSAIAGTGLFAAEPIAAGQLIWQFDAGFDAAFEVGTPGPPLLDAFLQVYGYLVAAEGRWYVALDGARFINHARDPNSYDDGPFAVFARRPIAVGEEITCNYFETCDDFRANPPEWA